MTAAARVCSRNLRYLLFARNVTSPGPAPARVPTPVTSASGAPRHSLPVSAASSARRTLIPLVLRVAERLQAGEDRFGDVHTRARVDHALHHDDVEVLVARIGLDFRQ